MGARAEQRLSRTVVEIILCIVGGDSIRRGLHYLCGGENLAFL
jgi:hypothetical protein